MDPSRAAELTDFIQQLDAEVPINPELLALVDQVGELCGAGWIHKDS